MKNENKIQQEIVIEVRNNFKDWIIFSVPNDSTNVQEQMRKKATGLLAGVSDLILLKDGKCYFIECKDLKGRQTESQILFQKNVEKQSFEYVLVRSLEEFKNKFAINKI